MYRAVARHALRRIRVARRSGLPVNALLEAFYFIGMALHALGWSQAGSRCYLMHVAVARLASFLAQGRVNTGRHVRGFIFVASRTLNFGYLGRMRKILDLRVAIRTS